MNQEDFAKLITKNKSKLIISKCRLKDGLAYLRVHPAYAYGELSDKGTYVLKQDYKTSSFTVATKFLSYYCLKR